MVNGLAKEEVDHFLEEHPTIIPLFEIDIIWAIGSPEVATKETLSQTEPDPTIFAELHHACDAFERELAISQRVKASTLESLNLGSEEKPRTLKIAYNLLPDRRSVLIWLLTKYPDVFA